MICQITYGFYIVEKMYPMGKEIGLIYIVGNIAISIEISFFVCQDWKLN